MERTECEQRVRKGGGGEEVDGKQSGVEGVKLSSSAVFLPVCCDMDVKAGEVHALRILLGSQHENAENADFRAWGN